MPFQKAEKKGIRGRIALMGPTGSGKTYWALELATRFAREYSTKIGVIDTEYGSAAKYADLFKFDVLELYDDFGPQRYIEAIREAVDAEYGILLIDSLSHAWAGAGGMLDQQHQMTKRMRNPNSYAAWREATPIHNDLVNTILAYPGHVIVTMRSKMEYVQEKSEQTGRVEVRKIGMQPVQRDGLDFEFDIVNDLNVEHELLVGKTRCRAVADKVFRPNEIDKFYKPVLEWLGDQSTVEDKNMPPTNRETTIGRINAGLARLFDGPDDAAAFIEEHAGVTDLAELSDDDIDELFVAVKSAWITREAKNAG